MHSHIICICVDAAPKGVTYEVIAEQQEQAQQETHEHPAQGPIEPSPEQQQPEGNPRCMPHYSNL